MGVITPTSLTVGALTQTDFTSVATASITPNKNKLIVVVIRSHVKSGLSPNTPTCSGCGLTWTNVVSRQATSGDASHRITAFRAMGSPSSGTLTFDFAGQTQNEAVWSVVEFSNVVVTGSNGADAVVQVNTNDVSGSSLTVTLSAFSNSKNVAYGVSSLNALSATITKGGNFTELNTFSTYDSIESEWAVNQTSVNWTASGSSTFMGIAIEIKTLNSFTGAMI